MKSLRSYLALIVSVLLTNMVSAKLENPNYTANITSLTQLAATLSKKEVWQEKGLAEITSALKKLVKMSGREKAKDVHDFVRALNIVSEMTGVGDRQRRLELYNALYTMQLKADILSDAKTWYMLEEALADYSPVKQLTFSTSQKTAMDVRNNVNKIIAAFNTLATMLLVRARIEKLTQALDGVKNSLDTFRNFRELTAALTATKERRTAVTGILQTLNEPEEVRNPFRIINLFLGKLGGSNSWEELKKELKGFKSLSPIPSTTSKITSKKAVNRAINSFNDLCIAIWMKPTLNE